MDETNRNLSRKHFETLVCWNEFHRQTNRSYLVTDSRGISYMRWYTGTGGTVVDKGVSFETKRNEINVSEYQIREAKNLRKHLRK